MQASRTFRVVLVDAQHGTGLGDETAPAREVPYAGQQVTVKL
jgi:alpha-D-xyloside xylohydrolase